MADTWLELVAATVPGLESTNLRKVRVVAPRGALGRISGTCRLIVQSVAPGRTSRILGSTQRRVTAEELRRGVDVGILEIGPGETAPSLRAWVEAADAPEDEFDGRGSRPRRGSPFGWARALGHAKQELSLSRLAA